MSRELNFWKGFGTQSNKQSGVTVILLPRAHSSGRRSKLLLGILMFVLFLAMLFANKFELEGLVRYNRGDSSKYVIRSAGWAGRVSDCKCTPGKTDDDMWKTVTHLVLAIAYDPYLLKDQQRCSTTTCC